MIRFGNTIQTRIFRRPGGPHTRLRRRNRRRTALYRVLIKIRTWRV